MKRVLWTVTFSFVALLTLSGCTEDHRSREEKQFAPTPEFASRYTMECPKCKAPQRPFRIDALKSYYKCSGQPPKFAYHEEATWTHRIDDHTPQVER